MSTTQPAPSLALRGTVLTALTLVVVLAVAGLPRLAVLAVSVAGVAVIAHLTWRARYIAAVVVAIALTCLWGVTALAIGREEDALPLGLLGGLLVAGIGYSHLRRVREERVASAAGEDAEERG